MNKFSHLNLQQRGTNHANVQARFHAVALTCHETGFHVM